MNLGVREGRRITNRSNRRVFPQQYSLPTFLLAALCMLLLGSLGCGQTAKISSSPTANQVDSYFGGSFPAYQNTGTTVDHAAGQISLSDISSNGSPAPFVAGTFTPAPTGFLGISEDFAAGVPDTQFQPPLVAGQPLGGAWAVEIRGGGALANLLTVNTSGIGAGPPATLAGAVATVENTTCPNFPSGAPGIFLFVSVPAASTTGAASVVDYGAASISTQGSAVTIGAKPFLIGGASQANSLVTGGCSDSFFGPITSFPLNSVGATNLDRIGIGVSGLLVDSFSFNSTGQPGAFGQNSTSSGVIGVVMPASAVDVSAVVGGSYNGFLYAPQNQVTTNAPLSYDATVLASAFGNTKANSQPCSALQSSIVANNGQGGGTVATLPSANSLYGGEFLSTNGGVTLNDPTGAAGSEDCDVVIDLGVQDPNNNGLFPNAQIFVGASFPPFSAGNPWLCNGLSQGNGAPCAVSFPAAAVVGKVQGRFVIFVVTDPQSTPPAQLPDQNGFLTPQPAAIFLFQKSS